MIRKLIVKTKWTPLSLIKDANKKNKKTGNDQT